MKPDYFGIAADLARETFARGIQKQVAAPADVPSAMPPIREKRLAGDVEDRPAPLIQELTMHLSDPMTQDDGACAEREDEAIREQRWTAFVEEMTLTLSRHGVSTVLVLVSDAIAHGDTRVTHQLMNWTPTHELVCGFAETEGWDGVLLAVARAMRASDKQEVQGR